METIIYIVFIFVYFFLDALHDSSMQKWRAAKTVQEIEKYSKKWHLVDSIIKGTVGGLLCYLIWGISLLSLQFWALFIIVRWIWFDAALNILNGLPIQYVGKTAFLDKLFKVPGTQYLFKFIILALVITSFFYL